MTVDVLQELAKEQLAFELIHHARTESAHDEAVAVGLADRDVGKTLVLTGDEGFVRAVLPASERLDLAKVRDALGGSPVRLATEPELTGAYPMFELGAVPPFGGPPHDRVLVDTRIGGRDSVVLEAGTHRESVRLNVRDLLRVTGAEVADICRE